MLYLHTVPCQFPQSTPWISPKSLTRSWTVMLHTCYIHDTYMCHDPGSPPLSFHRQVDALQCPGLLNHVGRLRLGRWVVNRVAAWPAAGVRALRSPREAPGQSRFRTPNGRPSSVAAEAGSSSARRGRSGDFGGLRSPEGECVAPAASPAPYFRGFPPAFLLFGGLEFTLKFFHLY